MAVEEKRFIITRVDDGLPLPSISRTLGPSAGGTEMLGLNKDIGILRLLTLLQQLGQVLWVVLWWAAAVLIIIPISLYRCGQKLLVCVCSSSKDLLSAWGPLLLEPWNTDKSCFWPHDYPPEGTVASGKALHSVASSLRLAFRRQFLRASSPRRVVSRKINDRKGV